jgi:Glycosyltransferase like family 2
MPGARHPFTYVLPIRSAAPQADPELAAYLRHIASLAETIVVDGSAPDVFARHAAAWGDVVRHVPPAPELVTPMGKVGGVLTGVQLASHEHVIIADDDVRYDDATLARVADALDDAHVVRPQNYFAPLPWHARLDSGRMLLNRLSGGDWPGTLGVRRSVLRATGGYDGRAMFENLELVRTVRAAGGREVVLLDAFVARRPSTTRHFLSQRVRQAYDELARPGRLLVQLAFLPSIALVAAWWGWRGLAGAAIIVALLAEAGRWRVGARCCFPPSASLLAPVWVVERALCSWLAVASRVAYGGVRYRGVVLRHAATSARTLNRRFAHLRAAHGPAGDPAAPRRSA